MPNVRELADMLRAELAGGQAAEGAASSPVQAAILSKFLILYSDRTRRAAVHGDHYVTGIFQGLG